jgi:hypothetical protein
MAAPPPSSATTELFILAILILFLARRTYRQVTGTRYSLGRLFVFAGVFILLFAILAFETLYAAVATWGTDAYALLALYVAFPAVAAFFAAPYVERVVRFEQREDGYWYYRLSWHVPVLYLVLFVVRLGAEVSVFGLSALLFTIPPPAPPSVAALVLLVGVDLLFGVSLGLLLGRGIGVYRAHRALPSGVQEPPQAPPLASA